MPRQDTSDSLLAQLPDILDTSQKQVDELVTQISSRSTASLTDREWVGSENPDASPLPPKNRLILADNLYAMACLQTEGLASSLDLIYVDPPFESNRDYRARLNHTDIQPLAYTDKWEDGLKGYLSFMTPRFILMRQLLSDTGSLYVHVDGRVSHYIKILLDEIFGRAHFRNEIIWKRDSAGKGAKGKAGQWSRENDHLLLYAKSGECYFQPVYHDELTPTQLREYIYKDPDGRRFKKVTLGDYSEKSIERLRQENRIYTTSTGRDYKKYYLDEARYPVGSNWTDIVNLSKGQREQSGYPTQKPEKLLERIITASCPEGGTVADFFSGSGTTGVVAQRLGRDWLMSDASPAGVAICRRRLASSDTVSYRFQSDPAVTDDSAAHPSRLRIKPLKMEKKQVHIELAQYECEQHSGDHAMDLDLLSHWSVDTAFDGKVFIPRVSHFRALGRKRDQAPALQTHTLVDLADHTNHNTICVRATDIYGTESEIVTKLP